MSEPAPGEVIDGRYELRRVIGRGGMATVFEARHVHTGRTVALKVLLAEHAATRTVRERLLREAHVLGAVDHPAVVEVYDAGIARDGRPYVAMQMLTGRSLEGILATRGTLPVEDTVHVGRQLCEALAAVHARGFVHRDVKPANVFLARDNLGQEVVKLMDFGVAALGTRAAATTRKLTPMGEVVGTPEYMAPEQMLGQPLDARCDVYAAGVTLYECLTGKVPFPGGFAEIVPKFAAGTRPPPLSEARSDLDPRLASVIERALSREPSARYADAGAFARALVEASGLPSAKSSLLGLQQVAGEPLADTERGTEAENEPMLLVRQRAAPIALQRRRYPRVPYVTPVRLERDDGSVSEARSEEISETGMLLLTEVLVHDGEPLRVSFALPLTGQLVAFDASVTWVRNARGGCVLGIKFRDVPSEARQLIAHYAATVVPPPSR